MQSEVVTTMMPRLPLGGGVATLPAQATEAVDLVCQRLMSRWGVSEKAARGMIALEQFGGACTKSPGQPRFRGSGQRRHLSPLDGE
jgi:hypothetical protein